MSPSSESPLLQPGLAEHRAAHLRAIPSVNRVLAALPESLAGQPGAVDAVRAALSDARDRVKDGGAPPTAHDIATEAILKLRQAERARLRPAINATGIILHTGLGRAVLAEEALENIRRVGAGHSTLEIDIETGRRGSRLDGVTMLLRRLIGCEDAIVVNNNAAAVLLAIGTLAAGREVVISHGQLVEIGGQFRIPDVIEAAGARLMEVGATNKTHLRDYKRALCPETALVLHVHPSNFRMVGFESSVPLGEMAALAQEYSLPSMADLGSGALVELAAAPGEPTVQAVHAAGLDICTWSGDKLLGGPQCGIITGRAELLARMKSNPLMRALRVDKLTLAALAATLQLYLDPATVQERVPTLAAITRSLDSIEEAGRRVLAMLEGRLGPGVSVSLVSTASQVGGGSLPGEDLPSFALLITGGDFSPDRMAARLREGEPAVFGRISQGGLLLDLRTVRREEEEALGERIRGTGFGGQDSGFRGRGTVSHDSGARNTRPE